MKFVFVSGHLCQQSQPPPNLGKATTMKRQCTKTTANANQILAQFERREAAAEFLKHDFGETSQGKIPPIDAVIMRQLHDILRHFDEDLQAACTYRGLLPYSMADSLMMASFLSFVLPSARAAQSVTGVPASALIAEAWTISCAYFYGDHFEWKVPGSHDIFATGHTYPNFKDAFLRHAESLAKRPSFAPVMRAVSNSVEYVAQLEKWSKRKYNHDLVAAIKSHNLIECDSVHG
jgi:hypothetical protein